MARSQESRFTEQKIVDDFTQARMNHGPHLHRNNSPVPGTEADTKGESAVEENLVEQ